MAWMKQQRPALLPCLVLATLLFAGCATTSEKIPGLDSTGHWKAEVQSKLGPAVDVAIQRDGYAIARVEQRFIRERRRKKHFSSLEHRWVLWVKLNGPTLADSDQMARELTEITALLPDGRQLLLPARGRTNERQVKFMAPYNQGEDLAPGPVAFVIDGHRIDLPAK